MPSVTHIVRCQKDTMDKKSTRPRENIDLGLNLVLARGLPYVWL